MIWIALIVLGIVAGLVSGFVGVGGGVLIVPALVMLFGFSQKMAQGTTLALLVPPIGIFAAYEYYRHGYVNITAAAFIVVGFLAGSLIGAKFANHLSNEVVMRVFAVFLIIIAVKLLIDTKA